MTPQIGRHCEELATKQSRSKDRGQKRRFDFDQQRRRDAARIPKMSFNI
jgi:hypothetical protein